MTSRTLRAAGLVFAAALLTTTQVLAQRTPEQMRKGASLAPDLELPREASTLSAFTQPRMALFRPAGSGPFPALVLHHQCGGLGPPKRPNASMLDWARAAVNRGYVVLLLDSLASRGVDSVCEGPRAGINFFRGARDAFQALDHLRKLDFVDPKRVALAGFSWGAMAGVMSTSKSWADALSSGDRFAAVVAFYPGCFTLKPPGQAPYEVVNADIVTPLLVLMGDRDTETPPADCVPRLEAARASGAPVQWHVYPGAHHCWDCAHLHGFRKTDSRGNDVLYQYDRTVTTDSSTRMFEFIEKAFTSPR
jgi:dienelactone hydrolase